MSSHLAPDEMFLRILVKIYVRLSLSKPDYTCLRQAQADKVLLKNVKQVFYPNGFANHVTLAILNANDLAVFNGACLHHL
jgi:hypothetical protein